MKEKMKIYIDDGKDQDSFFISTPLNPEETEFLSFDFTFKGHRVIKQKLVETKPMPPDAKLDGEWDHLVLGDGQLIETAHNRWIDMDQRDWVNDEIWETQWEKPLSDDLRDQLLKHSNTILKNTDNLSNASQEVIALEKTLEKEIDKHTAKQ